MLRKRSVAAFGVGDPSARHSAIWLIWAADPAQNPRAKADVYVVSRSLFASFKTSLHASGEYYTGWATEWVRANAAAGIKEKQRKIIRWTRPAAHGGITRVFRIFIPSSGLARFENAPSPIDTPVTWIPDPGRGFVVEIHLLLTQPGLQELEIKDAESVRKGKVAHFYLSSGENLVVYWRVVRVPQEMKAEIARAKQPLLSRFGNSIQQQGIRTLLFADMHDGGKALVDLSWQRSRGGWLAAARTWVVSILRIVVRIFRRAA